MTKSRPGMRVMSVGLVICITSATVGCKSNAGTGSLAGAGAGALIGQAVGRNTAGTLIGAGVGMGAGYIIGNEMDKNKAKSEKKAQQNELQPLAGTTWQLTSIAPESARTFTSMTVQFRRDGTVFTTRTDANGQVRTDEERYRIVGSTLIINDTDYIINGTFSIAGNSLRISDGPVQTAWMRIGA